MHTWSRPYIPTAYVAPQTEAYATPVPRPTAETIYQDMVAAVAMARVLEEAGGSRRSGEKAIQIVPSAHPAAAEARLVLAKHGINTLAPENGLFLPLEVDPSQTGIASPFSGSYFRQLEFDLKKAVTREDVVIILNSRREALRKR